MDVIVTLLLSFQMILVAIFSDTGFFDYCAVKVSLRPATVNSHRKAILQWSLDPKNILIVSPLPQRSTRPLFQSSSARVMWHAFQKMFFWISRILFGGVFPLLLRGKSPDPSQGPPSYLPFLLSSLSDKTCKNDLFENLPLGRWGPYKTTTLN